ncbi:MAG: hypothetical protein QNK03_00750 [Myxococcota bacterium]|nr:hypothetical protein [Myxococcota bacterium]
MSGSDARLPSLATMAALLAVFAGVALAVYAPALRGHFVSDDIGYVLSNPYVHALDADSLRAILDPTGPAASHTANYAPVHLLLHAVNWQLYGRATLGHHVTNVLLHALAAALLVALFARAGVPLGAAALGGGVFLLHPANVEAVAWIFQLKTVVALILAMAALWLEPQRPGLALLLFALALLTKITSAFALPVAAVALWTGPRPVSARRLAWLAGWVVALGLAFAPELLAFERLGQADPVALDAAARARATAAIVGRYVAMAFTSWGVSTFHQPEPPASWLDPWCLLGIAAAAAVAARGLVTLWRRDPECLWWTWAAAAFLPVSQLLPFLYPMADRYLYTVLPGLIGGLLVLLGRLGARVAATGPALPRALAVGLAAAVLVPFGLHARARAAIWKSELTIARDSERRYPHGIPATLLRARGAARRGDVESAVEEIRGARARGFDRFIDLQRDPGFAPVREDARFQAELREVAALWISRVEGRADPTPMELRMLGLAHAARGEWEPAFARLEQALAADGPNASQVRADLAEVRVQRIRAERAARRSDGG